MRLKLAVAAVVLGLASVPALAGDLDYCSYYAPGSPASGDFTLVPAPSVKWGVPVYGTPGGTVTYSFMGAGVSMAAEGAPATVALDSLSGGAFTLAQWKTQIAAAFAAWSAVCDIQFTEVADDGTAFNGVGVFGDIRIGAHAFDGPNGILAHGFFPPVNGVSAAGDIHFDSAETWKIGFGGGGFDIFQVAAHEIGHAIGLDHTGVPNSLMNPIYTEAFAGLQADDIAGGQFIYGRAVVQTVPLPGSLALGGLGLALAFTVTRRRKSQLAA